jgi:hypothetical protein
MTWQAPVTWTTNQTVTAAQLNAQLRDNMLETPAAKATTAGYHFVSAGTNSIAERAIVLANVDAQETTTATSYANLTLGAIGPSATATTGPNALVCISAQFGNSGTSQTYASYRVDGASNLGSSDNISICTDGTTGGTLQRFGMTDLRAVTPGSNTLKMEYRVNGGTGTFLRRRILVMAL